MSSCLGSCRSVSESLVSESLARLLDRDQEQSGIVVEIHRLIQRSKRYTSAARQRLTAGLILALAIGSSQLGRSLLASRKMRTHLPSATLLLTPRVRSQDQHAATLRDAAALRIEPAKDKINF